MVLEGNLSPPLQGVFNLTHSLELSNHCLLVLFMLLLCPAVPDVRDPGPGGHLHISLDFSQLYMANTGLVLYSKNQFALLRCVLQTGDKKEWEDAGRILFYLVWYYTVHNLWLLWTGLVPVQTIATNCPSVKCILYFSDAIDIWLNIVVTVLLSLNLL